MSFDKILKHASIFQGLSDNDLELISSIATIKDCNTGDLIFEEGSASDELYVIVNGEIDIQVDPAVIGEEQRGGHILITTLRRGQSFGEMALVSQQPRAATAMCAQHDSSLCVFPREALMRLCEEQPRLGYRLMQNLAADMARKIRSTDQLIQERVTWTAVR